MCAYLSYAHAPAERVRSDDRLQDREQATRTNDREDPMKTILIALLALACACGDDTSDTKKNNANNTTNTNNATSNNTNQAVEWSMTGDVEASG